MRKHNVRCRIESEVVKGKVDIQRIVNFHYAKNISKILQKAGLSKSEKIKIIEEIKKNIKKKL